MYAYCMNNPVMYVDPSGHDAEATLAWISTMWWLCGADAVLPIGDIIYALGIGVAIFVDIINLVGIDNIVSIIMEAPETLKDYIQWASDQLSGGNSGSGGSGDEGGSSEGASPGGPNWNITQQIEQILNNVNESNYSNTVGTYY